MGTRQDRFIGTTHQPPGQATCNKKMQELFQGQTVSHRGIHSLTAPPPSASPRHTYNFSVTAADLTNWEAMGTQRVSYQGGKR